MNILQKTIEQRKNYNIKSGEPMIAYGGRLSHPRKILRLIEKSKSSTSIKQEMRRLFLVTVAAAFELYWRDLIRILIDRKKINLKSNPDLGNLKFTIADIGTMIGNKITLGEIISCAYNFQRFDQVNKALSCILGFDAFAEFSRTTFQIQEVVRKNRSKRANAPFKKIVEGKNILKTLKRIEKCFEIRHATVHDTGARFRISEVEAILIENAIWQFNVFFELFIFKKIKKS